MAQKPQRTGKVRTVEGNDLLYHFLQKILLEDDAEQFQALVTRLVVSLAVWLPPKVYQRYPVVLPYAVRDPKCRGDKRRSLPDEWGSPDPSGRFRDDNSLVKGLPRSLFVHNPKNRLLHGRRLGTSFVASHVWRKLVDGSDAPRNWMTYSFVPNLVWLPSQLSKLSDREGSFVQTLLQALAREIYRPLPQERSLMALTDQIWGLLPDRTDPAILDLPDVSQLNYFTFDEAWIGRRIQTLARVTAAVRDSRTGKPLTAKVISSRYGVGLTNLTAASISEFEAALTAYLSSVAPA